MSYPSARFSQQEYDLLVIGGGINGAAVANIAAGEGLKVALLEKGDFASGTSSKSTKLVHGGLRYLEHFEFDLVQEALKERYIQLQSVPYLVKPLAFLSPVYKDDRRPLWMMKLGVLLYDILSGKYQIGRHRSLKKQEISGLVPGIKEQDLIGGVIYYDAQMDDARLCLENVLSAQAKGADVANYIQVKSFIKENGKVVGVKAYEAGSQKEFTVRARKIVCAVGPWAQKLLKEDDPQAAGHIRTTKGIHLVYRQKISDHALLVQTQKDSRIFFIIPWLDHSLIGTTDTDYEGSPDEVDVKQEDVDYLLQEARRILPKYSFEQSDIITSFAGLRPLVYQPGAPSRVSRKHVFEETSSGLLFILGGKYTTYRKIAMECVNRILSPDKVVPSEKYPLYGSGRLPESPLEDAQKYGVEPEIVEYLQSKYGTRYKDVLELTQLDSRLKKRICSCHLNIEAQIVYSIKSEMAATADDIIWRRLGVGYVQCEWDKYREVIRYYLPPK
jgi:glycerol-3-phosphate dehydrogenase